MSQYIHIGIVLITVPNLVIIGLMLGVFALAVVLPIPARHWATQREGYNGNESNELDIDAPPATHHELPGGPTAAR